jgi:hypothetical protein
MMSECAPPGICPPIAKIVPFITAAPNPVRAVGKDAFITQEPWSSEALTGITVHKQSMPKIDRRNTTIILLMRLTKITINQQLNIVYLIGV